MNKHTRGPWELCAKTFGYEIITPGGYCIFQWKPQFWSDPARGYRLNDDQCEALANGRLVAAAPEIYEALKRVLPLLELLPSKHLVAWDEIEAGKRAIAKAEGQS